VDVLQAFELTMEENRKRRYTSEEALSFRLGDTEMLEDVVFRDHSIIT
jgi:hypothetical protein